MISNAAANGCVSRSCFVRVLYSLDAASNIAMKLAVERSVAWSVVWLFVDIGEAGLKYGEKELRWVGSWVMGNVHTGQYSAEDKQWPASACTALQLQACNCHWSPALAGCVHSIPPPSCGMSIRAQALLSSVDSSHALRMQCSTAAKYGAPSHRAPACAVEAAGFGHELACHSNHRHTFSRFIHANPCATKGEIME